MSVSNMNPMRTDSKQIGLFENNAFKRSISAQIHQLRDICVKIPMHDSVLWDNTHPSHLLDAAEALFRDVIVPHSCGMVSFLYEQGDEQYSIAVKIAEPSEFLKHFKDIVPYFQVSIKVEDDEHILGVDTSVDVALHNQKDEELFTKFSDEFVPVKSFSAGSQRKVIDNAIAYLQSNVNGDFNCSFQMGYTEISGCLVDVEVPFGLKQKLAIRILYDNPDSQEE